MSNTPAYFALALIPLLAACGGDSNAPSGAEGLLSCDCAASLCDARTDITRLCSTSTSGRDGLCEDPRQ